MGFDPRDPPPHKYVAYGPARFPDARDVEMDSYVGGLRAGGPRAVKAALEIVSERGRRVLGAYAERAASRAVRNNDPELLVLALVALVVGGLDQNALETLMGTALVEDAGHRISAEPGVFFGKAADAVGHPGSVNLAGWLSRRPEDRTPECMGFEAGEDESGFRYRYSASQ